MIDTVDIDLTYAISEIQDIQLELETNLGPDGVIIQRLEGIEARLKEVTDALIDYAHNAPSGPFTAGHQLRARLAPPE